MNFRPPAHTFDGSRRRFASNHMKSIRHDSNFGNPFIGQELVELVCRVIADAGDHVSQIRVGIEIVTLGGDGTIEIEGVESEWIRPSPAEMGVGEGKRVSTPKISNRKLKAV